MSRSRLVCQFLFYFMLTANKGLKVMIIEGWLKTQRPRNIILLESITDVGTLMGTKRRIYNKSQNPCRKIFQKSSCQASIKLV